MSNPPEAAASSRSAATTEAVNSAPLHLFDSHLRFLTDSYLSFFQERKKIEEQYIEALFRLHRRSKTTDVYLDDRFEPSTTRGAWGEVRDNVEREAETRLAFVGSLQTEVIVPLVGLKETQERIRKRIREDLKEAITAHTEYEDNVFPKLKRTYMKKSHDVEEFRAAANTAPPLSPTITYEHNPLVAPKAGSSFQTTRPTVTAPQPLKPLDRRPSQNAGPARNRSPSTSTALQDLAHQGKRQLNQLMTFLDKGGNAKDGGRSDNALRTVRAKRDADEADREYRKAVHWLETLRLRRVKLLEGGYNSLESFVHESSATVKSVLQKYSDNLTATAATQAQLCTHARRAVDKINPDNDTQLFTAHIPRLLASATPKPHYYQHFAVGECRDLIFGVSLVDYATAKGLSEKEIPKIVRLCIKEVEERGLEAEGIYRVSGRHALVQDLQHKIERNEDVFEFHAATDDVYAISSLLKLYLRELPEPVFKFPLQERLQHTEDLEGHISNNFQLLRSKIRRLPPIHQATLKAIVEHLAKIASHSDKNKMDPKNLAIVFGSVIFGEDDMPKGGDLLTVQSWKDTLMEDLITHAHVLFQSSTSPPLPPAPAGEPVPAISYGSTHTKVAEIPPPPPRTPSPSIRLTHDTLPPSSPPRPAANGTSALRPQASATAEDFTPQMPPRPTDSIHPSLRTGAAVRQSLPPPPRSAQFFDDSISYAHLVPPVSAGVTSSVPPSPAKRDTRIPPSPLPLKSPWTDSAPSLSSMTPTSSTDDLEDQEISILPSDEGAGSAPSSGRTFASAISPTSSISSVGRLPVTPPMATKPLSPSGSPNRTSGATLSRSNHVKGASSSST